jgi:tetratricopeptide (TPR) repeat protein
MRQPYARKFATLTRAGERAASLGANAEAGGAFARAADLAEEPLEEARLCANAGKAARSHGDIERATTYFLRAIELYEQDGNLHAAARVHADLAFGVYASGQPGDAIERMENAYKILATDEPDEDLAYFLSQLARWQYFGGRFDLCEERNEQALAIAERLRLLEVLSHALNTKGLLAMQQGRWETSRGLIRHALEIALESDIPHAIQRAYTNLSVAEQRLGNLETCEELTLRALEIARRIGDRPVEWFQLGNLSESYLQSGKWDEITAITDDVPQGMEASSAVLYISASEVARHRGDTKLAQETLARVASMADSASFQDRSSFVAAKYNLLMAEGRSDEALALIEKARLDLAAQLGSDWLDLLIAEAALAADRVDRAAAAVSEVDALAPGDTGPVIRAQAARFRAAVAAAQGDDERAEDSFKIAAAAFREYGMPFQLACTQLEHAEWFATKDRPDEVAPLVADARETFERLRATPWLERADALAAAIPGPVQAPA